MKKLILIALIGLPVFGFGQILSGYTPFKLVFCEFQGSPEVFYNVNQDVIIKYKALVGQTIPELNVVGGPEITVADLIALLSMYPLQQFSAPSESDLTWNGTNWSSTFGTVPNLSSSCGGVSYLPFFFGYYPYSGWAKLWTVTYPSDPTGQSGNNFYFVYLE